MKIGILGGGLTGLTITSSLRPKFKVKIFEKEDSKFFINIEIINREIESLVSSYKSNKFNCLQES